MRISSRTLWGLWFAGLVVWTYLLCVPTDWLPRWFRFTGGTGEVVISWGKVGHFCAYALLAAWVWLLGEKRWPLWLALFAHAVGTEIVQSFVPTRTGKVTDVLLDWVGLTIGLALGWLGYRRWSRRRDARVTSPPQAEDDPGREDQDAPVLG